MKIIYGSPLSGKTSELIKEANKCNSKEILFFTTEIPEEVLKIERGLNIDIKVIVINTIEHLSIADIIENHNRKNNVIIKHIFVDELLSAQFRPKNLNIFKFNELMRLRSYFNIKVTFTCNIHCDLLYHFKTAGDFETTYVNLDNNKNLEGNTVERERDTLIDNNLEDDIKTKIKNLQAQKNEIDLIIKTLTDLLEKNKIGVK